MNNILKIIPFLLLSSCAIVGTTTGKQQHIFVVDGSGSMEGTPLEKVKNVMQTLAEKLFKNGDLISIITTSGTCSGVPKRSHYFDNITDLTKEMNAIQPMGVNSIPVGFKYAQEEMYTNTVRSTGHIYLLGDGDGIDLCGGMQSIVEEYRNKGSLAPFTYIGLSWTDSEKKQWDDFLKTNDGKTLDFDEGIEKWF